MHLYVIRVSATIRPSRLSAALGQQPQALSKVSGTVFPDTDHDLSAGPGENRTQSSKLRKGGKFRRKTKKKFVTLLSFTLCELVAILSECFIRTKKKKKPQNLVAFETAWVANIERLLARRNKGPLLY